jgi:hypothetical protein
MMASLLKIGGIAGNQHVTSEYVISILWIAGQDKDGPTKVVLNRELHVVDKLQINILIGTNIMILER